MRRDWETGIVCGVCGGSLVTDSFIFNDKHIYSFINHLLGSLEFFGCAESYDSHSYLSDCEDVKSQIVDKVYFECISSLGFSHNLQIKPCRKVK